MTALDPGDRAYADEQEHDAGSDRGEGDDLASYDPDGSGPPNVVVDVCSHPPSMRRLIDGQQVCTVERCGLVIEVEQAIVPRDRAGSDPTSRPGDESSGGLRYVQWDPERQVTSRPYTPEQVELEIVSTLDRIERGANFLTTQEEKRAAAKLQYDLAFARARWASNARSADQRADEAMLECQELYSEWQLLELTCRTAREGMHNLRSKLNGLQSVLKSISTALGAYR